MDRRTLPANGRYWRETRAIRGYAAKGIGCCDASFGAEIGIDVPLKVKGRRP
jgi:hypothetical protein